MTASLAVTHPEIAEEWDYEKNNGLSPSDVSKGQQTEVFWICKNGHSYQARIDHRCSMNSGCPYCSHKKPYPDETDLATVYPEIAAEWDYEHNPDKPTDYLPFSNKKKSWICPLCRKPYQRRIDERTLAGRGCSKCSGTNAEDNPIAVVYPELIQEWDYARNPKKPDEYSLLSTVRVSWICPICQRSYWRRIVERTVGQLGCRHCTKLGEQFTSQQEQAFAFYLSKATAVESRADVNGREVDVYLPMLKAGIEYHGEYYHRTRAVKDRAKKEALTASGLRLITVQCGRERAKAYDTVTLQTKPMSNPSDDEMEWAIKEVFDMLALPVPDIDLDRDRMEIYARYIHTIKENSLAFRFPKIAEEWDSERNCGLTPDMFSYGADKKVWWKCSKCGHQYPAMISSRTRGHGCPACAGKVVIKGVNDLETVCPDALRIWDYERNNAAPCDFTAHTPKRTFWKCDRCGHKWSAQIMSIASGCRCPECAKKNRVIGKSRTMIKRNGSFAEQHPELLAEWDYQKNQLPPDEYLSGSDQPVFWICKSCGHHWPMSIYCRTAQGQGCPKCGREKSDAARHRNILARRGTLAEQCPDLIKEWDYDKNEKGPECFTRGSKEFAWWKCSKGHSWLARIYSRARDKNPGGCPTCAGRLRCINLDTGEVFENYTEAAKSVGVTRKAITFAIRHKTHCKGYRWDSVEE